MELCLVTLIDL